MKTTIKRLYYIFLIIFRYPTCFLHEVLHFVPAFIFGARPELRMNVDFKALKFTPIVTSSTGSRFCEFIITIAPIFGILIPAALFAFTFSTFSAIFLAYQLINIKSAFLSRIDIDILKSSVRRRVKSLELDFDV